MAITRKITLLLIVLMLTNCSSNVGDEFKTELSNLTPDVDIDFSANSNTNNPEDDEITLGSLRNLNQNNMDSIQGFEANTTIREVALYEMALSMGMRGGLYSRAKEINQYLYDNSSILDQIFDFRDLMLPNKIIPPVLIEAQKSMSATAHEPLPTGEDNFLLNNNPTGKALAEAKLRVEYAQNNFRTLRITDRLYKIIKQARFGVTVPSWNDFIQMSYTKPMRPESAMLPKNASEQKAWVRGIEEGWSLGLAQADQIFQQNLILLKRDYLGMVRYKKLLAMNMVSEPYVAKRNYGVTGDGDEININDRVLTIAALPALKPDSKLWRPFLIQDQEQELESKLSSLDMDKLLKYLPGNKKNGKKNGKSFTNKKDKYNK